MSVTVVAELSGNHNGSLQRALDLVYAAKESGADSVKLQTFDPACLAVDSPKYTTLTTGPWAGRTLLDLYRETHLPWAWHARLFDEAQGLGMECFSSPFHPSAVAFLETLDCPTYKIASFEVGDEPLLLAVATSRKPVVMSTGLAEGADIDRALEWLGTVGERQVTLLHCVSEYPASPSAMNLRRMTELRRYGCPVGLSDHSLTPTAAVCATALGAVMIEKHLCLRRSDGGPDSGFSLEPEEFAETVRMVREAEQAMQAPASTASGSSYTHLRKSLWITKKVQSGEIITPENVSVLRPGNGMQPSWYGRVMGKRFAMDAEAGTPLTSSAFSFAPIPWSEAHPEHSAPESPPHT